MYEQNPSFAPVPVQEMIAPIAEQEVSWARRLLVPVLAATMLAACGTPREVSPDRSTPAATASAAPAPVEGADVTIAANSKLQVVKVENDVSLNGVESTVDVEYCPTGTTLDKNVAKIGKGCSVVELLRGDFSAATLNPNPKKGDQITAYVAVAGTYDTDK